MSRLDQKASVKMFSVSSPTKVSSASTFRSGFMTTAAAAAVLLFGCPTLFGLNKNWRFRLLTSILSPSVTVTLPAEPQPTPMSAKFLSISQPRAPAPTRKIFWDMTLVCRLLPRMAMRLS